MGTHPIFESDFDCLTDVHFGKMGGNRKTSSTKGGKYMNPTDQARKEERKKQLKKHKRQREQVREAVIKSKNPNSVLDELAKLDDLEFDAENECPYADRVMQ